MQRNDMMHQDTMDKKADIERDAMQKGNPAEEFILDTGVFGLSLLSGLTHLEIIEHDKNTFITDVARRRLPYDAIFTIPVMNANGEWSYVDNRVEVKARDFIHPKNAPLETQMYPYTDKATGIRVPERPGFFVNRATDWYALVYLNKQNKPQHAVFVRESELWEFVEDNKRQYPERRMGTGLGRLVPIKHMLENCQSCRKVYAGNTVSLSSFMESCPSEPYGITGLTLKVDHP